MRSPRAVALAVFFLQLPSLLIEIDGRPAPWPPSFPLSAPPKPSHPAPAVGGDDSGDDDEEEEEEEGQGGGGWDDEGGEEDDEGRGWGGDGAAGHLAPVDKLRWLYDEDEYLAEEVRERGGGERV